MVGNDHAAKKLYLRRQAERQASFYRGRQRTMRVPDVYLWLSYFLMV